MLNVTVTNGVVDLWGRTDSDAERKAIRVAARRPRASTRSTTTWSPNPCEGGTDCKVATGKGQKERSILEIELKILSMCLPGRELVPYMVAMRTPGRGLLRAAMAVVFGFMSLVHGPVMTFAKATPARPLIKRARTARITITLRLQGSHNLQRRI